MDEGHDQHALPTVSNAYLGHGREKSSDARRPEITDDIEGLPHEWSSPCGIQGSLLVTDELGVPMHTNSDGNVSYMPGTVRNTPIPNENSLHKYDSEMSGLMECAFESPDRVQWDDAEEVQTKHLWITTDGFTSLYRILKRWEIDPDQFEMYRNWLLFDSTELLAKCGGGSGPGGSVDAMRARCSRAVVFV